MPQDPALPPKPVKKIDLNKEMAKSQASAEHKREAAQATEKLLGIKGQEFDSPQALAAAFQKAPTVAAKKQSMRRIDWSEKTKQYTDTLNNAYIQFKTAKVALTPPTEDSAITIHGRQKLSSTDPDRDRQFVGDRAPLKKTFFGRTKEGAPGAAYEREVASLELPGLTVGEKLAKLGKTPAEAQADMDSAQKVLESTAASYQNDVKELLVPLEAKRNEIEQRLEKSSGGRVATGRGDKDIPAPAPKDAPAAAAPAPATPSGDPALPPKPPKPSWGSVLGGGPRTPSVSDRAVSSSRLSIELGNINQRIIRGYKTIDTIQNIVSGQDRSLFTKRWDPDPETARFVALLYLIANRDLAGMYVDNAPDSGSSKMGVLRGPGDKYYEGDILNAMPEIPERPPTDIPPTEAIQRFVQILEGIGLDAALNYARLTGTPLSESIMSLDSAYFKLHGFSGDESFLNGRYCHLVSAKEDHAIVKVLDEDVHKDDRIFKVSFDEIALIDGTIR